MSEAAALLALAASLAAAVTRPRWAPDWAVAAIAALLLVAGGVLSTHQARHALAELGPTVGFLAALLVLAGQCGRAGLFEALGGALALGARGRPRRLLALVFVAAAATTAVLSLDATVVLLTPIVFATAARLRANSRPHIYACSHLANSASLLLPVSNLTNLLAFRASGLAFARFAELMVVPWLAALAVEWLVLSRAFRAELEHPVVPLDQRGRDAVPLPVFPLVVVGLTLVGFALSSVIGVAPAWIAAAGAAVLALRNRAGPGELVRAASPTFVLFVLSLGVVVNAASVHGLSSAVDSLLVHGTSLGAMLVGVNVGPNLTYTGSLATLLWRRVVHAHDEATDLLEFTRLGALTVPPVLVASSLLLWLALRIT